MAGQRIWIVGFLPFTNFTGHGVARKPGGEDRLHVVRQKLPLPGELLNRIGQPKIPRRGRYPASIAAGSLAYTDASGKRLGAHQQKQ